MKFFVPVFEPLPPQYFIRVISDRWIGKSPCFFLDKKATDIAINMNSILEAHIVSMAEHLRLQLERITMGEKFRSDFQVENQIIFCEQYMVVQFIMCDVMSYVSPSIKQVDLHSKSACLGQIHDYEKLFNSKGWCI